jgi:D-glycerate 3-kinase
MMMRKTRSARMNVDRFLANEALPTRYREVIARVHAPLAAEIAARRRAQDDCLIVGICGAQGSGKSTMSSVLAALLAEEGFKVAMLSLDDLYLTRAERVDLSKRVHSLLLTRGVPGTHDIALGERTLDALRGSGLIGVPRFDKARDERMPEAQWPQVQAPVDVIVFEGWCVGARPQTDAELESPINALERECDPDGTWRRFVNEALSRGYQQLFSRLHMLVLLEAPSFDVVYRWRVEQEHKLRDRSADPSLRIMSDEQIARFISHYERLTRHILTEMPPRADIVVRLDEERSPVAIMRRHLRG